MLLHKQPPNRSGLSRGHAGFGSKCRPKNGHTTFLWQIASWVSNNVHQGYANIELVIFHSQHQQFTFAAESGTQVKDGENRGRVENGLSQVAGNCCRILRFISLQVFDLARAEIGPRQIAVRGGSPIGRPAMIARTSPTRRSHEKHEGSEENEDFARNRLTNRPTIRPAAQRKSAFTNPQTP